LQGFRRISPLAEVFRPADGVHFLQLAHITRGAHLNAVAAAYFFPSPEVAPQVRPGQSAKS
jgi:hypothetical protein